MAERPILRTRRKKLPTAERKRSNSLHRWILEEHVMRYQTMLAKERDPARCQLIKQMLDQKLKSLRQMEDDRRRSRKRKDERKSDQTDPGSAPPN